MVGQKRQKNRDCKKRLQIRIFCNKEAESLKQSGSPLFAGTDHRSVSRRGVCSMNTSYPGSFFRGASGIPQACAGGGVRNRAGEARYMIRRRRKSCALAVSAKKREIITRSRNDTGEVIYP